MKARWMYVFGSLLIALPCVAIALGQQHPQEHPAQEHHEARPPHANQGHIPPAPPVRKGHETRPEVEHGPGGKVISTPHVNNNHWYGHEAGNDARFHQAHPYEHGHFAHFGPSFRYSVVRIDRDHHRFWFNGGSYFEVASWDWTLCQDWNWNNPDEFVVYEDPDHDGWYLLYNTETGVYVHVTFMGS